MKTIIWTSAGAFFHFKSCLRLVTKGNDDGDLQMSLIYLRSTAEFGRILLGSALM
jgi:hypothetical protein